jgi:hypothetical protein
MTMALPLAIDRWLPRYAASRLRRQEPLRHAWVAVADHFEPYWRNTDDAVAAERVRQWGRLWPEIAKAHVDSSGRPPVYTFFYPQEEYRQELMDGLAAMVRMGFADVEIHLHHDGEGEADFVDRISTFRDTLAARHGLLREQAGRLVFGFIHGNWALDNARPDGRWCGLNNEISLLARLGCYADFTLPCVPSPAQAGPVNCVYWATDDPERPRSHDSGVPVVAGGGHTGDLLMIPGPLALNWEGRRIWRPRIETGELAANWPPSSHRVRLWLEHAPRIAGHGFVKLFTHGTQERNSAVLLGGALSETFRLLAEACQRGSVALHYTSTWGMRQVIDGLLAPVAAEP